jgi:hypothetical protein
MFNTLVAHSEADFTHGMCSGCQQQMRQRISGCQQQMRQRISAGQQSSEHLQRGSGSRTSS